MPRLPLNIRRVTDSLVFRLIVFGVLLISVGTAGRVAYVSTTLRDGIESVVSRQLASLGHYVASDIQAKISDRRQLLALVSAELAVDQEVSPSRLSAALTRHQSLAPLFSLGVVVVPLSGQGVWADFPPLSEREGQDFSKTDWFRAVRTGAPFFMGAPAPDVVTGQSMVAMASPVLGANGQVVAVLAGLTSIDAPGFLNPIQSQGIGRTGGFLLVSARDHLFVAASKPELRLKPVPPPGVNALHDRAMAGWRGTGMTLNAFGVEELVAVVGVAQTDWFVVARMPTQEAFETVSVIRSLIVRNALVFMGVMAVALTLTLSWLFRPMKETARQMRKMADGDIPLSPLTVVRHDEVGEMVEGFNHLMLRLRESEDRLSHMAHHDPLTGLPNRRALVDRAFQCTALAQRQGSQFALLFVDIDGFKPVNDQWGHDVGDLLLQSLARRLTQTVRQADVVARLGGDEFVVLLTDVPDRERVAAVASKLIGVLSQPCEVRERTVSVGASIGIALYPSDATDVDDLMGKADQAMYQAKRAGRRTFHFATA
jgi:diguanylate cyclase (GGDEF)-like protein